MKSRENSRIVQNSTIKGKLVRCTKLKNQGKTRTVYKTKKSKENSSGVQNSKIKGKLERYIQPKFIRRKSVAKIITREATKNRNK